MVLRLKRVFANVTPGGDQKATGIVESVSPLNRCNFLVIKWGCYGDPAAAPTSGTIYRLSDVALSILRLRKPLQS